MPYSEKHLFLTREQLYELAWSQPMQHIAKTYGVSDRAMAKLCARKQVPVPPRGYWAKKLAGNAPGQPLLAALIVKQEAPRVIAKVKPTAPISKKVGSNFVEERDRKFKQKLKDHHRLFSDEVSYVIRINSWQFDYGFGLNERYDPLRRHDVASFMYRNLYDETKWLELKGDILEPKNLKGQKIEVGFLSDFYLNESERDKNLRPHEDSHASIEWRLFPHISSRSRLFQVD